MEGILRGWGDLGMNNEMIWYSFSEFSEWTTLSSYFTQLTSCSLPSCSDDSFCRYRRTSSRRGQLVWPPRWPRLPG